MPVIFTELGPHSPEGLPRPELSLLQLLPSTSNDEDVQSSRSCDDS